MVFPPCCIKSLCCKGKSAKAKENNGGGEWFEPIRRKSRNQRQVSAQESVDSSYNVESSGDDASSDDVESSGDDDRSGDDDGIENNDSAPTSSPKDIIKRKGSLESIGEEDYNGSIRMSFAESQQLGKSITGDLSESEANLMYECNNSDDEDKDEV